MYPKWRDTLEKSTAVVMGVCRQLEPFPFRLNRNGALSLCLVAFSRRKPVSTLLENAPAKPAGGSSSLDGRARHRPAKASMALRLAAESRPPPSVPAAFDCQERWCSR